MFSITKSWGKVKTFWTEVRSEVKKVTFPSRDEVVATTAVVLVTSVIFAFFLWVSDIAINRVYRYVNEVLS